VLRPGEACKLVGTEPVEFPAMLRPRGRGQYGRTARGVVTTVSIALQNRRLVKPPFFTDTVDSHPQRLWKVTSSSFGLQENVRSCF
jgi:hypothetical protein